MQPTWNDPKLKQGTMVRTALWLASEVGVGGVFTKQIHRAAFSNVTQADRRLRDLRKFGWVIHTNREDAALNANEQRLVRIGEKIWESGPRKKSPSNAITRKQRAEALRKSNYQCAVCGIYAGDPYPDMQHLTAVLGVFETGVSLGTAGVGNLTVRCKLCKEIDGSNVQGNLGLIELAESLHDIERRCLSLWLLKGRSKVDDVWQSLRSDRSVAADYLRRYPPSDVSDP